MSHDVQVSKLQKKENLENVAAQQTNSEGDISVEIKYKDIIEMYPDDDAEGVQVDVDGIQMQEIAHELVKPSEEHLNVHNVQDELLQSSVQHNTVQQNIDSNLKIVHIQEGGNAEIEMQPCDDVNIIHEMHQVAQKPNRMIQNNLRELALMKINLEKLSTFNGSKFSFQMNNNENVSPFDLLDIIAPDELDNDRTAIMEKYKELLLESDRNKEIFVALEFKKNPIEIEINQNKLRKLSTKIGEKKSTARERNNIASRLSRNKKKICQQRFCFEAEYDRKEMLMWFRFKTWISNKEKQLREEANKRIMLNENI